MKNEKLQHDIIIAVLKIIMIIFAVACFGMIWSLYYSKTTQLTYYWRGSLYLVGIYFIIYLAFCRVYDALQISVTRISEIVFNQFLAIGLADVMIYIIIALLAKRFTALWPGLICFAVQFALSIIWAKLSNSVYFSLFKPRKSIVVYDTREGMESLIAQYGLTSKYDIKSIINVEYCINKLDILKDMEVAFLSGIHSRERNIILKKCVEYDVRVFVIPRIGDVIMSGAKKMHMFHLPMLRVDRYNPSLEFKIFKRFFDIVLSLIVLVITSPVMLYAAIAIKTTDKGPVFYKQTRLTKDGKQFKLIKFRSMRVDAEKDGVARLSSGDNDDRITPIGRKIRKLRIDELPQLLNILKGDMSFIGPRPERPEIVAQYEEVIPEFKLRLQAKAGLTGYAQIYGKYNTTPYDKLILDLMYIANPSFLEELSIFFATIKIIFVPDSTEGVAAGQTTAMNYKDEEDIAKYTIKRR